MTIQQNAQNDLPLKFRKLQQPQLQFPFLSFSSVQITQNSILIFPPPFHSFQISTLPLPNSYSAHAQSRTTGLSNRIFMKHLPRGAGEGGQVALLLDSSPVSLVLVCCGDRRVEVMVVMVCIIVGELGGVRAVVVFFYAWSSFYFLIL